jgi:hypothetical protein
MIRLTLIVMVLTASNVAALAENARFVFPGWAWSFPSTHSNLVAHSNTVADFNADGTPDVALLYSRSNHPTTVTILYGQPNGSLGEPRDFSGGPHLHDSLYDMAAGDLVDDPNGLPDGLPDLVVGGTLPWWEGDPDSVVTILRNLGPPHYDFEVYETYTLAGSYRSERLTTADFDADGFTDIAHTGRGGSVYVRFGPTFDPAQIVLPTPGGNTRAVASADLDADSYADLVVRDDYTETLTVLYGRPDQTFDRQEEYPCSDGGTGAEIAVADFDGNGRPDIALGGNAWTDVHVYYASDEGGFDEPEVIYAGTYTRHLATGDIDGNGRMDLVTSHGNAGPSASGPCAVLYSWGATGFSSPALFFVSEAPYSAGTADLDHDGRAEIIIGNANDPPRVSVHRSRPRGPISSGKVVDLPADLPLAMTAADLDRDGYQDLAVAVAHPEDNVVLLRGLGDGNFEPWIDELPLPGVPRAIVAAYLDEDDSLDLAVANSSANLTIWPGGPDGQFSGPAEQLPVGAAQSAILAADFDRDGRTDAALLCGSQLIVLFGKPGGTLDPNNPVTQAIPSGATDLAVGYLDKDTCLDIAVCHSQDADGNTVTVYYGLCDEGFSFLEPGPDDSYDASDATWIGAGDVTGDGLADLITSYDNSSPGWVNVSLLASQPGGGFLPEDVPVCALLAGDVYTNDFDRDGIGDAVVGTRNANLVLFGCKGDGLDPQAFEVLLCCAGTYPTTSGPTAIADFDNDGRPDIARAAKSGPRPPFVFVTLNQSTAKIHGDLAVISMSAPPKGVSGQLATVSWTVQNQLDSPISGMWTDAVYLSRDESWDINDIRIGTLDFLGELAPHGEDGDFYEQTLEVALPGVVPKTWFLLVRTDATDAVREDTGEIDNVMASPIDMDLPELPICEPEEPCPGLDDFFAENRTALYYKLVAREGEDLLVTLDAASDEGINELYIRYEVVPSRSHYDAKYQNGFASDQTARIPGTEEGTYYVLAYTDQLPAEGPADFNLRAEYLPFEVTDVTPERGGNTGNVTTTIVGSGIQPGTTARLLYIQNEIQQEILPRRSEFMHMGQITATFDLREIEPVVCNVVLTSPPGATAELPEGFTIEEGQDPALDLRVPRTGAFRPFGTSSLAFEVEITNESNVDAEFVVVTIWGPDSPEVSLVVEEPEYTCGLCDGRVVRLPFIQIPPLETVVVKVRMTFPWHYGGSPDVTIEVRTLLPEDVLAGIVEIIEPIRQELLLVPDLPPEALDVLNDPELWSDLMWDAIRQSGWFDEGLVNQRGYDWRCVYCLAGKEIMCYGEGVLVRVAFSGLVTPVWAWVLATAATRGCFELNEHLCDPFCDGDDPPNEPCRTAGTTQPDGSVVLRHCPPRLEVMDPNDKLKLIGWGEAGFVRENDFIPYTIRFENLPEASAAVLKVEVTDPADPNNLPPLDWTTLTLDEVAFGGTVIEVPEGLSHYEGRVEFDGWTWNETDGWHRYDLEGSPVMPLVVDVEAAVDIETGEVHWSIACADPNTGYWPEDAYAGFLPPNLEELYYPDPNDPGDPNDPNAPPRMIHPGEGSITFSVRPLLDLPTGTEIRNVARIVFDWNAPIDTPEVLNTIDAVAPSSEVSALPPQVLATDFEVCWTGVDDPNGSGIESYTLYVSEDGESYGTWITTEETCAVLTGVEGCRTYYFYSIAHDHVGHVEPPPTDEDGNIIPDAVTTTFPTGDLDGDSEVNLADLSQLLAHYGMTTGATYTQGDLDSDEDVDLADLAILLAHYGETCE